MTTTETPEAVAWATAAGAAVGDVLHAWRKGQAADVPIGSLWDVLRVTSTIGFGALDRLMSAAVLLGPILEVREIGVLEFVVPAGTATSWPALYGTTCVDHGNLRCPAPRVTIGAGRAQSGRSWLVPPVRVEMPLTPAPQPWTDDDLLCEAVAAATAHSVGPYLPRQRKAARAAI